MLYDIRFDVKLIWDAYRGMFYSSSTRSSIPGKSKLRRMSFRRRKKFCASGITGNIQAVISVHFLKCMEEDEVIGKLFEIFFAANCGITFDFNTLEENKEGTTLFVTCNNNGKRLAINIQIMCIQHFINVIDATKEITNWTVDWVSLDHCDAEGNPCKFMTTMKKNV